MCGQFAKPRSSSTETINGVTLPSFKGEIINKSGFTKEEREPKPQLMLEAYDVCVQTKKVIDKYHSKFYIAHEALLLQYEEALVRKCNGGYYLASTDLP
jgi:3-deoxy-7-phosphoheptulonate synthase